MNRRNSILSLCDIVVKHGFNFVAFNVATKAPVTAWKHLQRRAMTEEERGQQLTILQEGRAQTIALLTGFAGLVALDFDSVDKKSKLIPESVPKTVVEKLGLTWPYAWAWRSVSGAGWHVYVVVPDLPETATKKIINAQKLRDVGVEKADCVSALELRLFGQCTMVPPSVVLPEEPPARVPWGDVTSLFGIEDRHADDRKPLPRRSLTVHDFEYAKEEVFRRLKEITEAPEGKRNYTLYYNAKRLFRLAEAGSLNREEVFEAVEKAAASNKNPEDERSRMATIKSALKNAIEEGPFYAPANLAIEPAVENPWPLVPLAGLIADSGINLTQADDQAWEGTFKCPRCGENHAKLLTQPAQGVWQCTSCGLTGDAADWVAYTEGITREDAKAFLTAKYGPGQEPLLGTSFRVTKQGVVSYRVDKERNEIIKPLSDFVAWIEEERVFDNGYDVENPQYTGRTYVLRCKLANGHMTQKAVVPASRFEKMDWVQEAWGAQANIYPNQRDALRFVIQRLSKTAKTKVVYAHTGWRYFPEHGWCFLHYGGAIGAQGVVPGIDTQLVPQLRRYNMPAPPSTPEMRKAAGEATVRFLEIADPAITIPLLAAAMAALLAEANSAKFSLWLLGTTGSWKSTMQALISNLFGGPFDDKTPPTSWESTENALERIGFEAKDLLLWIDDYRPPATYQEASDLDKRAGRYLREVANSVGRDRMKADTSMRDSLWPRCLPLCSGELLPSGASVAARIFVVPVDQKKIDKEKLSAAQEEAPTLYPLAGALAVQLIAQNMDVLKRELPLMRNKVRDGLNLTGHKQHTLHTAKLLIAFNWWLSVLVDIGALDATRANEWADKAREVLTRLAVVTSEHSVNERLAQRFIRLVSTTLQQGLAHLRPLSGARVLPTPREKTPWGWPDSGETPNTQHIGWVDEERGEVYLLPTPTLHEVAEYSKVFATKFIAKEKEVADDLNDSGLLVRKENNRLKTLKRVGDHRYYVWVLPVELFRMKAEPEVNEDDEL